MDTFAAMEPNDVAARQAPESVAASVWRSKATTLARLAPQLRASRVPASLVLDHRQWRREPEQALAAIAARFGEARVAVRSSCLGEDAEHASQAGRYRTVLDVPANQALTLRMAIDAVFASYDRFHGVDEVLLQTMVRDVHACCVAATHTFDHAGPYYVFDFVRGRHSDAVTRGDCVTTTHYLARGARQRGMDPDMRKVCTALREIERLHPQRPLEAEFVLSGDQVWLLQVRPIAIDQPPGDVRVAARLRRRVRAALARAASAEPEIFGTRAMFGAMPDWNPAELLGEHPRPLALSIFRMLIAHSAWRQARAALGYRNLARGDLLAVFAGRPYVDVRQSFNSLLPAGIDKALGTRLVDAWLARLAAQPHLHDRVEFEVASTCVDFDFAARDACLYPECLAEAERKAYRTLLLSPTRNCLQRARLDDALAVLRALQADLHSGHFAALPLPLQLQRARDAGAQPFAQIARQAFVAEALLRSAVRCGALQHEHLLALRSRVATVSGEFLSAWQQATHDEAALAALLRRFGHLRPGTFEIAVPTYAARSGEFIGSAPPRARASRAELDANECRALAQLCAESALGIDADGLIAFHGASIQARELGKFVLARAVSEILERIAREGAAHGLGRDALTWLNVEQVLRLRGKTSAARAEHARQRYEAERLLKLPALIEPATALASVRCAPGTPSFHGRGVVSAPLVEVTRYTLPSALPLHAIVAIESADPGFDWIFARAPAALLTAWGGPNSHMAIRCAELDCPAVLGYGAENLRALLRHASLSIDFDSGTLCTSTR